MYSDVDFWEESKEVKRVLAFSYGACGAWFVFLQHSCMIVPPLGDREGSYVQGIASQAQTPCRSCCGLPLGEHFRTKRTTMVEGCVKISLESRCQIWRNQFQPWCQRMRHFVRLMWTAGSAEDVMLEPRGVPSKESLGAKRVEGREGQRERKQSGPTSEASGGSDCRTCSSV